MRFFADVHRKSDNSGWRITYTTDGEVFKHVDNPAEIPAGNGDQIYVDTIPIIHTDSFIELLRRGVEVYYLRRLSMVEAVRQRLKIPKSGRGDVKVLMHIDQKWFRRVDEDFLLMRRLISAFRGLLKTRQRLRNMFKAISETERRILRREIRANQESVKRLAEIITEEAGRRYPAYNRLVEELGLNGENLMAKEALAELLTLIDLNRGIRDVKCFLGLFKGRPKLYNGTARRALERLTISMAGDTRITAKQMVRVVQRIRTIYKETIEERLAGTPAQQQG